jgi:hypothetical protein
MERHDRTLVRHTAEIGTILAFCGSTMSVTSTSLSSQACNGTTSGGVAPIRSGTTPLVIAEMIFCRNGANGTMLRSTVLPLAFW